MALFVRTSSEMLSDWNRQRIVEMGASPEKTKVTLELDNSALEFFKREARKRNTSYQRMIRNLVRSYAQSHT